MTPPTHWDQQLYRACALCTHGTGPETERACTHPAVAGRLALVPVAGARANTGACGPEAHHMSYPGFEPIEGQHHAHHP